MKIAGLCSSHDCSFAVLENGIPVIHAELERYIRKKEPEGDSFQFLKERYPDYKDIKHFSHFLDWDHKVKFSYPGSYKEMNEIIKKNNGDFWEPGHHESHAANAFFSSNYDKALIITIDGGGLDSWTNEQGALVLQDTAFTIWAGENNKIKPLQVVQLENLNIGGAWQRITKKVFGLSNGYPKGNQAGTVMAMACMGDPKKFKGFFTNHQFLNSHYYYANRLESFSGDEIGGEYFNFQLLEKIAFESEKNRFDIASALQEETERIVRAIFEKTFKTYGTEYRNFCFSGGVVLNSVLMGKLYDWFDKQIDNLYVCPVPYDSGLSIGSAQYIWHQVLDNPRITWEDNATPYLGELYGDKIVDETIIKYADKITVKKITDNGVLDLLADGDIVSVFGGRSESGRRALGNRSILADPRCPNMKDKINEKVKHRQWFRPFAPSILREDVSEWFVRDIDSPYMSFVIKFKKEVQSRVPAVVHHDGTARLQTVTKNDNEWYHKFLTKWKEKSGVPILLNTSFNDREPIVETPEDAIKCFLGTDIDSLYFFEQGLLVTKA
tara:strand:+ start:740 stop:2395 length:1656 start_codon:yes stop_codon:yes gene_type:complete